METKYKVYKITSPDGMVYIGYSGEKRIKDRWRKHIHQHTTLEPYIEKYGYDNLLKEVVKDGLTKQEAIELEGILIDEYKEKGCCINKMGSGGEEMLKDRIKGCSKRYRDEHKEEIREKQKIYREENKEKRNEQCRQYRKENKEKCKMAVKRWCEEHKEEMKEYRKRYREANREKLNEQCRLWREKKKLEINN